MTRTLTTLRKRTASSRRFPDSPLCGAGANFRSTPETIPPSLQPPPKSVRTSNLMERIRAIQTTGISPESAARALPSRVAQRFTRMAPYVTSASMLRVQMVGLNAGWTYARHNGATEQTFVAITLTCLFKKTIFGELLPTLSCLGPSPWTTPRRMKQKLSQRPQLFEQPKLPRLGNTVL